MTHQSVRAAVQVLERQAQEVVASEEQVKVAAQQCKCSRTCVGLLLRSPR